MPEGQFDVDKTFYEGTKSFLHVLAREKQAKKAPAKGAPAEPPPVAREPFNVAVLNAIKSNFGDDENLVPEKFKDEKFKANTFKKLLNVPLNGKEYQIYLFKEDPYEVALVFGFDPADKAPMSSKVKLALEAFAVGAKAKTKFNNGGSEEEAEGGGNRASPSDARPASDRGRSPARPARTDEPGRDGRSTVQARLVGSSAGSRIVRAI